MHFTTSVEAGRNWLGLTDQGAIYIKDINFNRIYPKI